MDKLIVILGPTASGKSELAVKLARKFNCEVVSADSRQVYKGMDIGTGKITPDTKNSSNFSTGQVKKKYIFTHKGIPHYCIDVASPKRKYTVARFKKEALKAIKKIHKMGKVPIICGGTGFYIQAVVDKLIIPKVEPDWKLRKKLEKKTIKELFEELKKMDPRRAKTIEPKNKRRLIRALEIVIKTNKPVPTLKKEKSDFALLIIGIKKTKDELEKLITKRLFKRIKPRTTPPHGARRGLRGKQGMIAEVKKLHKDGVSWKRLEEFGLEYRWLARYLQNKISYHQMLEKIQKQSEQFAKRQMTWFKKDKRTKWIRKYREAEKLVKKFLN